MSTEYCQLDIYYRRFSKVIGKLLSENIIFQN